MCLASGNWPEALLLVEFGAGFPPCSAYALPNDSAHAIVTIKTNLLLTLISFSLEASIVVKLCRLEG